MSLINPVIMKKQFLFLVVALCGLTVFAQQERDLKLNSKDKLIEVVYYHDNGVISQTGSYNLDGKLQGEWLSFDAEGNKTALAVYDNGEKVGKWFFWSGDTLKEVDYENNSIANVVEWNRSSSNIAIRD